MEKKCGRILWIDAARGIAFLAVMFSHLRCRNAEFMSLLSPFFLTVFFFISGYLFKSNHSFKYVFEQRTRTLFIPLIVLSLVCSFDLSEVCHGDYSGLISGVKAAFIQGPDPSQRKLWFIAALYVFSIAFYFVDKICKNNKMLFFVSFFLFLINCIYIYYLNGPYTYWYLHSLGLGCSYMGFGKLYKTYEPQLDRYFNKWTFLALSSFYVIFVFCSKVYYSYVGSRFIIDSLTITLLGILLIIYISKKIAFKSRYITFVGANTLLYFAIHGKGYQFLQNWADKVSGICGNYWYTDLLFDILTVLIQAALLMIPTYFVNRYCQFILGKGFHLYKTDK